VNRIVFSVLFALFALFMQMQHHMLFAQDTTNIPKQQSLSSMADEIE
jgi:hypothetical protein